jgi:hypothetical protein
MAVDSLSVATTTTPLHFWQANASIWYAIYFGPQQQFQPGTGGPGWWPPTNPAVTMNNVAFRNITAVDGLLWPGVFRRNESNPSYNISLTDVLVTSWNASLNYVCNWTTGPVINSSPVPPCFNITAHEQQLLARP